jgi:LmbE family N-acetylglucosaminyl deacetylase
MLQCRAPERKGRGLISLFASMNDIAFAWRRVALAACVAAGVAPAARAQLLAPAGTGGIAALDRALRGLDQNKRILVIGAHPDDEDTELLTFLSRGSGADVAYLSLTRGEGGQNLIGRELSETLGLLRTEELLAARGVDGAHQFFTRAIDFGYSKTLDETLRFWPQDTLTADVLRVIRRFQPQVLVSVFSGTPRDGHGQHQAAGVTAQRVFALLRDSTWGPRKLFRATRFDTAGTTAVLASGALDPVAGQTYHQLAMASRSLHRSQEMGRLQDVGASQTRLGLVEDLTGRPGSDRVGSGVFAGVDTALAAGLSRYAELIDSARTLLTPREPSRIVPLLAAALVELRREAPPEFRARKEPVLEEALATAAGVVADAIANDGHVVEGQPDSIVTSLWAGGGREAPLDSASIEAPPGWTVQLGGAGSPPSAGGPFAAQARGIPARRFAVTAPAGAPLSAPYFLARPPAGALYDWSGVPDDLRGEPLQPPLVFARLETTIAGVHVTLRREVLYRYNDEARGEVRRPIFLVPALGVEMSPSEMVWPTASSAGRAVTVTLTNGRCERTAGEVRLEAPAGWPAIQPQPFLLEGKGASRSYTFEVFAPRGVAPGSYTLRAVASTGGADYDRATFLVDYSHIRPVAYVRDAALKIEMADLTLPRLARVGYVRGAADVVPEALQGVGIPVNVLSASDLEKGDLARFDAIVVGSRAYETDPALVASNGRMLDYARQGGLLIVQYQQYPFVAGRFAPFPLTIARPHDRVTDETAPVTVLEPGSPLFRAPNVIGAADWDGWVQERGLYFAHTWDAAYRPMLEMGDGGERLHGGLLVAHLGSGLYVYTGLSFFRQLPAGIPGAYRLFANLLALRPADVQ